MPTQANFQFYRGEDLVITVQMNPITDITGWSLQFTVRQTLDILPILITKTTGGGGIVITSPLVGVFQITINKDDTATAAVGNYLYDIQRTDPGFVQVLTIGTLTLEHPVRNIPP